LLLGREVNDVDGRPVGKVHDLRLRRDGPFIPGFGAALRVEGLLVRPESLARRLGIDRANIAGPWPLDVWGRRAARRARFVPWESLTFDGKALRTSRTVTDLPSAYS
jgi:hypothetical protein